MKTIKIELSEKDIKTLNRIKKFLNKPNSSLVVKYLFDYNKLVKSLNKQFWIENYNHSSLNDNQKSKHKKGRGCMTGLSGCTWDFSKMSALEAEYMKDCLKRDIEQDRMMNPMKYLGKCPINFKKEEKECLCEEENKKRCDCKERDEKIVKLLDLLTDIFKKNEKANSRDILIKATPLILDLLAKKEK